MACFSVSSSVFLLLSSAQQILIKHPLHRHLRRYFVAFSGRYKVEGGGEGLEFHLAVALIKYQSSSTATVADDS